MAIRHTIINGSQKVGLAPVPRIVTGMNRQGFMLHLSNVDATTWRATFGREPMLSSDGFGTGPIPWRAVQVAAWEALGKTLGEQQEPTPAEDTILP